MSLRALVTGVAGLKTYTEGLDVIGNNVANVDTTAYKASRVTYKEVFTQTLKQATRLTNPQQVGLGVKVGSIDVNHKQGALKSTGRDTDMAIEGDGFFVLQNPMDATETYFSRDGSFVMDSDHNLVNTSGAKIMGWMADSVTGSIDTGGPIVPINIPIGQASFAVPTENVHYSGNLDSTTGPYANNITGNQDPFNIDYSAVTIDRFKPIADDAQFTVTTPVYDSLGNVHTLTEYYFKLREVPATVAIDGAGNQVTVPSYSDWTFRAVLDSNTANPLECEYYPGTTIDFETIPPPTPLTPSITPGGTGVTDNIILRFDGNGQFVGTDNIYFSTASTVSGYDVHPGTSQVPILKFPAGEYTLPWAGGSVNSFSGLNNGSTDLVINLDFLYSTQLNGSNSLNANNQDGYSLGTVNGFTVGADGVITVSATNGHFRDLGQLALANFNNPEGLRRLSNNVFYQTPNSGIPQIGEAGSGGRGTITASYLESSNVDLAEEFTRMIITQRAIQANSKVITTASEVLQEANNLIR